MLAFDWVKSDVSLVPVIPAVQRILILGCPGVGKTNFARHLAVTTGLPLIHLDDEYWGPDWRRTSDGDWVDRQCHLVAHERWIIDGNYLPTVELRAQRADAVIVLDAPGLVCAWRVLMRTARIWLGHPGELPVRTRTQSTGRVAAAHDLPKLLRTVLVFNRTSRIRLLEAAGGRNIIGFPILLITTGPAARWRACRLRRMLNLNEWRVRVISYDTEWSFQK